MRKTFVCLSFFNVFEDPKTHFGDLCTERETDRTEGCRPARCGGGGGGGGGRRPAAGGRRAGPPPYVGRCQPA